MICFCITILILLLLIIISVLLIKRNKQNNKKYNHNNIYKLLEGFTAFIDDSNKVINVGKASAPSSELIGKNGVLQTLPHCNDLKPGSKFPKCCSQKDLVAGKCYRSFPQNPNLKRTDDGKWTTADNTGRDDGKYVYNPLFPYARTDYNDNPNISIKLLDALVKYVRPESTVWNIARRSSTTLKNATRDPVSVTENNLVNIKNYLKLLSFGKDKSPKEPCDILTGKNCIPIGKNRWQKIGRCPGEDNQELWAYIDVQNKNNTLNDLLNKQIKNGLTEGILKDLYSLNPIGITDKLVKTAFSNTKCMSTNANGTPISYVPYLSDLPPSS